MPGTVKSDAPSGTSLVGELGTESGMTPLHLASYSGNENVVRLLLNSAGVQVEAATTENVCKNFENALKYGISYNLYNAFTFFRVIIRCIWRVSAVICKWWVSS